MMHAFKAFTTSRPPDKRHIRCWRYSQVTAHSTKHSRNIQPPGNVERAEGKTVQLDRRSIMLSALLAAPMLSRQSQAFTDDDASPLITPAAPLSDREEAIIDIFERSSVSVANVFDITLQGAMPKTAVDQPEGNGTGFVWDRNGHIVTNYHVLGSVLRQQRFIGKSDVQRQGNKIALVNLLGPDGITKTYEGYFVGADRSKDIAVLRINAPEGVLRPLPLGDSNAVRVGQQVLAIGNPFGFALSLSTGVLSGVGREIMSAAGVVIGGGLQSDAAINPGNRSQQVLDHYKFMFRSGGPLIDSRGLVIGINTAIFTNSGTSAGVGFAIPIATVARVVPQLIEFGRVVRPCLRIQVAPDQIARALRVTNGALVQSVSPNSNAAFAGIMPTRRGLTGVVPGDVIVGVDGKPIRRPADLITAFDDYNIGDTVMLQVQRDSADSTNVSELSVKLEEEVT